MRIFLSLLFAGLEAAGADVYRVGLTGEPYPIKETYPNSRSFFIVFNETYSSTDKSFLIYNGLSDGVDGKTVEIDFLAMGSRFPGLSASDFEYKNTSDSVYMAVNLVKMLRFYNHDVDNFTMASPQQLPEYPLAYSWDYGDVHYVQLHAYPTYNKATKEFDPRTPLSWLEDDLKAATERNKVSLIIFTEGYGPRSKFVKRTRRCARNKFRYIIEKYDVKGIFTVCKNGEADYCKAQKDKFYGNVPVYCTGRLGENEYTILDVNGTDIAVARYSFLPAIETKLRDVGIIGKEQNITSSCSR